MMALARISTGSPTNLSRRFESTDSEAFRKPEKDHAERPPLDSDRQNLAGRFLNLAYALAKPYQARYPQQADQIESAATFALVNAAADFDSSFGSEFGPYARLRIQGSLKNVVRDQKPRGYRNTDGDVPQTQGLTDSHPSVDDPTKTVEDAEIVGVVMAKVGPRLAEVLRLRHLEGKTTAEVGMVLGCTKQHVSRMELQALGIMRSSGVAG